MRETRHAVTTTAATAASMTVANWPFGLRSPIATQGIFVSNLIEISGPGSVAMFIRRLLGLAWLGSEGIPLWPGNQPYNLFLEF